MARSEAAASAPLVQTNQRWPLVGEARAVNPTLVQGGLGLLPLVGTQNQGAPLGLTDVVQAQALPPGRRACAAPVVEGASGFYERQPGVSLHHPLSLGLVHIWSTL